MHTHTYHIHIHTPHGYDTHTTHTSPNTTHIHHTHLTHTTPHTPQHSTYTYTQIHTYHTHAQQDMFSAVFGPHEALVPVHTLLVKFKV